MSDEDFRERFLFFLTTDSVKNDRRRKDWRRAVFDRDEGWACWTGTDLGMVMHAFDLAMRDDIEMEGTR